MSEESINPFAGTDLEEPWQQGFTAGVLAPDEDHTPPSPLTPEAQDAYAKGVTAGEFTSGQLTVPPGNLDESGDWQKLLDIGGHALAERAGFFMELVKKSAAGGLDVTAVVKVHLGAGLSFIMFLVFSGALTGDDIMGDALRAALGRVREKLASAEFTDNVDLFMPVCDRQGHGLPATDEIFKNGFWHGRIFPSFDDAAGAGATHEHVDSVRIVHSQTAAPDILEVLEMPNQQ